MINAFTLCVGIKKELDVEIATVRANTAVLTRRVAAKAQVQPHRVAELTRTQTLALLLDDHLPVNPV